MERITSVYSVAILVTSNFLYSSEKNKILIVLIDFLWHRKMTKVYIVLTIEHRGSGEDFVIEKVFSNLNDAVRHKLSLEFNNNTEYYPKKNKNEWEIEYNSLLLYMNMYQLKDIEEFKDISKDFVNLADRFAQNEINKSLCDLPVFRSHIKEMTVDNRTDEERKRYDHC